MKSVSRIAIRIAIVKLVLFLLTTSAAAQTSTSIVTQALDRTAFWVQTNPVSLSVPMFDGSFGLTPLFNTPGLVGLSCLQPAGAKCIYHISVETAIRLSSNQMVYVQCTSAIRVLVDGRPPTPGPRGGSSWGVPNGGLQGVFEETVPNPVFPFDFRPHTVSVVAVVTNAVANQLHAINLDLWVGSACVATANGAIATIQVYH